MVAVSVSYWGGKISGKRLIHIMLKGELAKTNLLDYNGLVSHRAHSQLLIMRWNNMGYQDSTMSQYSLLSSAGET
jgi:hypothetical protein